MNVCSIGIESQTYPGALNTLRWYSTPQTPSDPGQLRKIEMRNVDVLSVFTAKLHQHIDQRDEMVQKGR